MRDETTLQWEGIWKEKLMERGMRERKERRGVGGSGDEGGYHGKFCSSDWSAERESSSIMYIIDP